MTRPHRARPLGLIAVWALAAAWISLSALSAACSGADEPFPEATAQTQTTTETAQPALTAEQQQQPQPVQQPQSQPQPRGSEQPEPQQDAQQTAAQEQGEPQGELSASTSEYRGGSLTPAEYDPDFALAIIDHLTNQIGPRSADTAAEVQAAEYLAARFRSLGYETEIQSFTFRSDSIAAAISISDDLIGYAFLMDGASPGTISGPLVDVPGVGTSADFASVDATGAVAVVNRGMITFAEKTQNAVEAGAAALLVVNRDDSPFLGVIEPPADFFTAGVSAWQGGLLRERAGEVVTLSAGGASMSSVNVIARKPNGQCRVVVGGHIDSVPSVVGANDNASGTAVTAALAQAWSEAESARQVCFVGFGAEELGLHGSRAFVARLRAEGVLSSVSAMLNLDAIGDGEPPLILIGTPELQTLAAYLAEQLDIPARPGRLPPGIGSDHQSFRAAGVSVIFPLSEGAIVHVPSDNFDNLDRQITADAGRLAHALLACLLYEIDAPIVPARPCSADHAARMAPTLDHEYARSVVEHLSVDLGTRASGTEEEIAAADYLQRTFESFGYEVERQAFTFRNEYSYAMIQRGGSGTVFGTTAGLYFEGSARHEVEGPLLDLTGAGRAADYEGINARGAIVIVDRGEIGFAEKAERAVEAGAIALVIANRDDDWFRGDLGGYESPIPVIGVGRLEAHTLRQMSGDTVTMTADAPDHGGSENVIAKLPNAACAVVVGGHYDTVPRTPGTNDNASGTALMIGFARAYADHPAASHICFVGFGAEELGLHGSMHFVDQLRDSDEIEQVRFMLNLDAIGDGAAPIHVDAALSLQRLAGQVGAQRGVRIEFAGYGNALESDHLPFHEAGAAVLFAVPQGGLMHVPADSYANFDFELYRSIAGFADGMIQCLLLRAGAPIAPNLTCETE